MGFVHFNVSEMFKRLLFEFAKLGSEVRQLRRLVEHQGVQYDPAKDIVVPELCHGPVSSLESYRSLQKRCSEQVIQHSLVCFDFR